jgi:hypothetical protein
MVRLQKGSAESGVMAMGLVDTLKREREETRVADDGGMYTQTEFIEHFGGTAEWDAAETRKGEDGFTKPPLREI